MRNISNLSKPHWVGHRVGGSLDCFYFLLRGGRAGSTDPTLHWVGGSHWVGLGSITLSEEPGSRLSLQVDAQLAMCSGPGASRPCISAAIVGPPGPSIRISALDA